MPTVRAASWRSLVLALLPCCALGQEFFGSPEINYWGEEAEKQKAEVEKARAAETPARRLDERPFRWEDYEDPSSEAFWDEGGDYIAPRPLRVAAANPTPENVANYLRWQKKKVATVTSLNQEVMRQLGGDAAGGAQVMQLPQAPYTPPSTGGPSVESPAAAVRAPPPSPAAALGPADASAPQIDWRKVQMVFFYQTTCPHCKASVPTVEELRRRGATVIPVQLDWKRYAPLFANSVPYTEEIAKQQPVDATPLWVATYDGNRVEMSGEVSLQSIEVSLQVAEVRKRNEAMQSNQQFNVQSGG